MRAMLLEFPADPGCAYLDRQYMLGPSLLVAPIFGDDGKVTYYLPPGRWTNLVSGAPVDGGGWRTETHDYLSLPVLARPGSIIAMGADSERPDYDYADGVTFHVFEAQDGMESRATVVTGEGKEAAELTVHRAGRALTLRCVGTSKPWRVCVRNVSTASAQGGSVERVPEGSLVVPAKGIQAVTVTL